MSRNRRLRPAGRKGADVPVHPPAGRRNNQPTPGGVDARNSMGVLVGNHTTQHNTQIFYSYDRLTPTDGPAPPPLVTVSGDIDSPYRGLNAFDARDSAFFFGRESTVDAVLERIGGLTSPAILMVSGVSGAGKSSLLQAGVLPQLRETGLPDRPDAARWPCLVITPTDAPIDELAVALASNTGLNPTELRSSLQDNPEDLRLIARQATAYKPAGSAPTTVQVGNRSARLLLVVDQFEQLFTRCQDESQRQKFVAALHAAATMSDSGTLSAIVVIVVRADFEARCADYPELARAVEQRFLVRAMTERQLRMAITQPARMIGGKIDDEVVEALLSQLATPDSPQVSGPTRSRAGVLPLVSHALDQAWRVRRSSTVTIAEYERIGGVEGAVADSAQRVYNSLSASHQAVARLIFTRMAVTTPDGADAADRVPRNELLKSGVSDADVQPVLEAFAAERLLVLDADTVEISHEVLLTAWPLLRDTWLAETKADRMVRSRLQNDAAEWIRHNHDPSYLYGGSRLDLAADTVDRLDADTTRHPSLSQSDRDFLKASLRARRRATLRRRALISSLVGLVLALSLVAVLAIRASQNASHQRDVAIARQLVSESTDLTVVDPSTARLKSLAAWRIDPSPNARHAMLAIASSPGLAAIRGHAGEVSSVAFSPDGKTLASGSFDNSVRLWDVASHGQVGSPLTGHKRRVHSVAFSPDGKTLATGGFDNSVRLWDVASHRQVGSLPNGHASRVLSVAFSPDGKTLASGSGKSVRLWDVARRRQIGSTLTGHRKEVVSVVFSPDGKTLASRSLDESVRLWDVASHRQIGPPLTGHAWGGFSVAFSPDGKTLASASNDNSVRLWDVASHRQVGSTLTGHASPVLSVAFSPDGRTLASGSSDASVRLWDVASHRQVGLTLTGHTDRVVSVAFSPDGTTLATGSNDASVRLWDVARHRPVGSPLTGHTDQVFSVVFSPDGKGLASGSADNSVRLWDVSRRRQIGSPLTGHRSDVVSVVFSPDGKTLASGSSDNLVRLWDVASHRQIGPPLSGHMNGVSAVVFSPDGKTLASGSYDDSVRLWDVAGRRQIGPPLTGHTNGVSSVAFSPDGRLLTSGDDASVRVWDVASRRQIGPPLTGHTNSVLSLVFSPDGRTLASGSYDNSVRLWDVASHHQIGSPLTGQTVGISVVFSPDGKTLASGSTDASVRLWDVASHRQIGSPLTGHINGISSVAFSPDGKALASSSGDELLLWDVSQLADPASSICDSVAQPFTRDQWRNLVPPGPKYRALCP